MLKYIGVTLVALYAIGSVFGQDDRRVEVSRAASDPLLSLSLAAFAPSAAEAATAPKAGVSLISDADAVRMALDAAVEVRANRTQTATLRGAAPQVRVASVETATDAVETESVGSEADAPAMWYVTGTNVNIRSGPGTGNAVVAQLGLGTAAEPLSDPGKDWIEIRLSDGGTGWIFGKFLSEANPG